MFELGWRQLGRDDEIFTLAWVLSHHSTAVFRDYYRVGMAEPSYVLQVDPRLDREDHAGFKYASSPRSKKGARAAWLMDPGVSAKDRRARVLVERLNALQERRKFKDQRKDADDPIQKLVADAKALGHRPVDGKTKKPEHFGQVRVSAITLYAAPARYLRAGSRRRRREPLSDSVWVHAFGPLGAAGAIGAIPGRRARLQVGPRGTECRLVTGAARGGPRAA
jgi:hypothetical protein